MTFFFRGTGKDLYLTGVVVHIQEQGVIGSLGHYITYIRAFNDKIWYEMNDSAVVAVTWSKVTENAFGHNGKGFATMLQYTTNEPIFMINEAATSESLPIKAISVAKQRGKTGENSHPTSSQDDSLDGSPVRIKSHALITLQGKLEKSAKLVNGQWQIIDPTTFGEFRVDMLALGNTYSLDPQHENISTVTGLGLWNKKS